MTRTKSVAVGYCGGCNASYDRAEFVRTVLEGAARLAGTPMMQVHREENADVALIMCGCPALCVDSRPDMGHNAVVRHVIGPDLLDYQSAPQTDIEQRLVRELSEKTV